MRLPLPTMLYLTVQYDRRLPSSYSTESCRRACFSLRRSNRRHRRFDADAAERLCRRALCKMGASHQSGRSKKSKAANHHLFVHPTETCYFHFMRLPLPTMLYLTVQYDRRLPSSYSTESCRRACFSLRRSNRRHRRFDADAAERLCRRALCKMGAKINGACFFNCGSQTKSGALCF